MKCSECGGTGEVEIIGDSVTDVCDKCGGTGFFCEMRTSDFCALGSPCPHQKPMTNEEYIRICSTEELAEFITKVILSDRRFRMTMAGGVEETKAWLKEIHND